MAQITNKNILNPVFIHKIAPNYKMHSKLRNRYIDLIEQTFDWPTLDFKLMNNHLYFHDIPLMEVMEKFGSPIKITYLPKISAKIRMANELFNNAIQKQ
jgi:hypothetical protein